MKLQENGDNIRVTFVDDSVILIDTKTKKLTFTERGTKATEFNSTWKNLSQSEALLPSDLHQWLLDLQRSNLTLPRALSDVCLLISAVIKDAN